MGGIGSDEIITLGPPEAAQLSVSRRSPTCNHQLSINRKGEQSSKSVRVRIGNGDGDSSHSHKMSKYYYYYYYYYIYAMMMRCWKWIRR